MAGRPTKVYTIEDIEAKLEPWALSYLYIPEHEARREFLVSERASLLTKSQVFTELPQNEYAETLVQISIQGQAHPKFLELPDTVKEKFFALEGLLTPKEFKLRRAFRAYYHPEEGEEKQAEYFLGGIYRATKFINLYYKWVLTPPSNGRPNFYSCFTAEAYPYEIQKLFKDNLVMNCDMIVHFSDFSARNDTLKSMRIPKKQEEIFDFIKKRILIFVNSCNRNKPYEPTKNKPPYFWLNLIELEDTQFIDEIAQALEAVTLEDVTARPSTRKEKEPSLFTGESVLQGAGHIPLVEEFSKLGERDAVNMPLSGVKHYENNHSDMMLDMVKSEYLMGKEILKDVLTDKIVRTTFHIGTQLEGKEFFRTGIIKQSKEDFMRFMGIPEEKISDETTRRNFTKDITEQLEMLMNCSFVMRKGKGGGAGCHILDAYNTKSQEFYIRLGKEFVEVVTRYGKIAWTPTSLQANKIPNRNKVEYFLQIKLENDFTSIYTQANERDTIKVSTLLNYLEEYGAIDTSNPHYKRKVIDRFIGALDYLQNVNKSIEYYFTTAPDKDAPALEGPELEKYKSKANFSKLYLWYTIPELERFRNEEDAKNRIAEKRKRALASQARRERARDNKLGELEAERIDKAREKAEAEAKAQNEQPKAKTLTDYFKQGNQ